MSPSFASQTSASGSFAPQSKALRHVLFKSRPHPLRLTAIGIGILQRLLRIQRSKRWPRRMMLSRPESPKP